MPASTSPMVIQTLLGAEEERSKLANQSYTIYVLEKQEDPAAGASAGFQQVFMPSQSTAGEITAELKKKKKKDNAIVDANNIENEIGEGKCTETDTFKEKKELSKADKKAAKKAAKEEKDQARMAAKAAKLHAKQERQNSGGEGLPERNSLLIKLAVVGGAIAKVVDMIIDIVQACGGK